MNIPYLKNLAKSNPALARAIELSIYSIIGYLLSVSSGADPFSTQALIQTALVPLAAYISKMKRDLDK